MNEKDEDNAPVPIVCANLLSGKSLLHIHTNSGKSVPKEGSKEFKPTNSWMEKKQIQSILDDRKELLEVERVEKWGCLAGAVWDHKKKLAEVIRRTGKHFQTLGFEKEGALYLYPEEALFLLETNSLELTFGGVPVSIQQGYSLLLGSSTGCDLNEYRTYSYLLRQGYKLLRCTKKIVHTKYERTIRLDQHTSLKRKHPGQITNEANSSRKIKIDPCSIGRNELGHLKETETKIGKDERQNFMDDQDIHIGERRLEDMKEEPNEERGPHKSSSNKKHVNPLDSVSPVQCLDQHNENKCAQDGILVNDESGAERDYTHVGQGPESEIQAHQDQNSGTLIDQSKTDQHVEVTSNSGENMLINSHDQYEECSEVKSSEEVNQSSIEGAKTKAFGIAESLFSLGSVIVGKNSNTVKSVDAGIDLNDTLQSEIIKVLGAHIETDVSEEALTAIASSAASTILSHITSGDKSKKYSETELTDPQIAGDGKEQSVKVLVENTIPGSQSPVNFQKDLEQSSDNTSGSGNGSPRNLSDDTNNGNHMETSQDKKRPASPNEGNNFSSAVSVKKTKTIQDVDLLTEKTNFVDKMNDSSQDAISIDINYDRKGKVPEDKGKRKTENTASVNNSRKKCELENIDLEVEIIDVVPEKKVVEFVNLSDESSRDDSVKGLVVENYDNDGIEVIDVQDTSSAESSDSDSTSSDSDDSVIVEEKRNYTWEQERRKILETIPDMYNLSEISIKPPSSDLLPEHVQPQRSCYRITRRGLLKDNKEKHTSNSQLACLNMLQTNDFNEQVSSSWQPPGPVNDLASVRAIAQLILPMLGLDPSICLHPSNRAWMPHNPWFSSHSGWNPEPHVNLHPINERHWNNSPRGNWANSSRRNWTNSPRGNWTQRHNFAQRPFRGRGNRRFKSRPNYFKHFSPRYPYQQRGSNFRYHQNNLGHLQNNMASNEVLPSQSLHQNQSDDSNDVPGCSTKTNENLNEMRPWSRINKKQGKVKKVKNYLQGRYFCPPTKYSHMHKILDENQEVISLHSDELSTNQSSSTKSESDSSKRDFKIENLDEDEDTTFQDDDNTDDSSSSHSGTNPLLSPEHCTSFASVFKTLQVIREADTRTLLSNLHEDIPSPKYDMFHPNKPFKKGSPPTPDFHLCIVGCTDSVPTPRAVRALSEALDDSVPILFGIISPDSISFVQLCDVSLPFMALSD